MVLGWGLHGRERILGVRAVCVLGGGVLLGFLEEGRGLRSGIVVLDALRAILRVRLGIAVFYVGLLMVVGKRIIEAPGTKQNRYLSVQIEPYVRPVLPMHSKERVYGVLAIELQTN